MRFLAGLTVLFGVLIAGMQTAGAQVDGLSYTEDTVFTITDDGVQVVVDAVMTNTSKERRSGNTIYYSYFDTYVVIVPIGVEDLVITSRGSELSSSGEDLDEDFELRTVRLPTQLRSGQSRSFAISYTLPKGEIRGDGLFFSNPAFHAFPMWSFSDPGTGSILLRVPEDADMGELGDLLRPTERNDGYMEWIPQDFETPEDLFAYVTVTVDDELERTTFDVAGQSIELRSWPGDEAWATFATVTISDGLPKLEELIGLPVPEQDTLQITESVTPYFYGYGGWYNPADTSIEIGNDLNQTVMVHELTHAWFNHDLFAERWVAEGLAEEYTWRTMNELNWDLESLPETPNPASPVAVPLVSWGQSGIGGINDEAFLATEKYGYETSWYVMHELYELVGRDGMQAILAAADADTTAYPGDDLAEVTNKQGDWRRLLDLAALQVEPEVADDIEALFVDYVVADSSLDALSRRNEARQSYDDFIAEGLAWRAPDALRHALELWQFDTAEAVLANASAVQGRYTDVLLATDVAHLELSDAARNEYERARPDYDGALTILDSQLAAISDVQAVRATVNRERSNAEQWGLGDTSLQSFAQGAEAAFATDDPAQIAAAQAGVDAVLIRAAAVGAERLLWARIGAAAMGLLVLGGIVVIVRGRRLERAGEPTIDEVVLAA